MATLLGSTSDGRVLTYDASLYEFSLDGESVPFPDVQMLDVRNWMRWRAPELRDWFRRIIPADLDYCNRLARSQARAAAAQSWEEHAAVVAQDEAASSKKPKRKASEPKRKADSGVATSAQARADAPSADPKAGTTLEYRTTDDAVATVDNEGTTRILKPGRVEIYARRIGAGGAGPEMRMVTLCIDEALFASRETVPEEAVAAPSEPEPVDEAPMVMPAQEPEPMAEPTPMAEPAQEPMPMAMAEPTPMAEPAQEPMPMAMAEPMPMAEPAPMVERAMPAPMAESPQEPTPLPAQEPEPQLDAAPLDSEVQPLTSSVLKGYRTRAGKLASMKEIQLEAHLPGPVQFRKLDGASQIAVSEQGVVSVPKGLPAGRYSALIEAAPLGGAPAAQGQQTETITFTVKVK